MQLVTAARLALSLLLSLTAAGCISDAFDANDDFVSGKRSYDAPGRSDGLPFSHGVAAGDTYYLAGSLGLGPDGMPPADAAEEARLVMDSIRAKLALVGLDMGDLVSVQVFCPDTSLYETFNEVYGSYFDGEYPVRSFIGSGPLLRGARFEVNGVATLR